MGRLADRVKRLIIINMKFNEFMLKLGFFVKESGQTVQNYASEYTTEVALKLWEAHKLDCQKESKRSTR